jgi:hypothetical protein
MNASSLGGSDSVDAVQQIQWIDSGHQFKSADSGKQIVLSTSTPLQNRSKLCGFFTEAGHLISRNGQNEQVGEWYFFPETIHS